MATHNLTTILTFDVPSISSILKITRLQYRNRWHQWITQNLRSLLSPQSVWNCFPGHMRAMASGVERRLLLHYYQAYSSWLQQVHERLVCYYWKRCNLFEGQMSVFQIIRSSSKICQSIYAIALFVVDECRQRVATEKL